MEEFNENMKAGHQKELQTGLKCKGKVSSPPKNEPDVKDQYNLADHKSRVTIGDQKNFIQGCNAQAVFEYEKNLIVAAHLRQKANDEQEIQPVVEPEFGVIKSSIGVRRFRLRGLKKVTAEWKPICASYKLKKMYSILV
ncbi:MAG: transposase [Deltaproteobacteria bacterium]|nr:transposase [Deltaproteobacteria bacterium]